MCPFFVLVTLGVSVFNLECCKVLGEDPSAVLPSSSTGLCLNCTACEHPCHPLPPPSPPSFSGYPSYGAPPPPSLSTYPSYGAPPPPTRPVQANCPPAPVQCCQYPTNPNPNEYYHPVDDNHSHTTPYSPVSSFSVVIMLLLSFAGLFF